MEYAATLAPSSSLQRVFAWMFVGLLVTAGAAALNGVLFAFILELYTAQSIFTTFLITSAMLGALAAYGYLTKTDLSKLGPILFMALVGLILATIVNIFVASSALYWITTYAGVAIFAGLTALLRIFGQGRG